MDKMLKGLMDWLFAEKANQTDLQINRPSQEGRKE